jgi:hypothetical protein
MATKFVKDKQAERAAKKDQAPSKVVSSQEAKIKKRGGKVTFKRDGNLPVGLY